MSRDKREAQMEALYGGPEALVVITERGGRKRDTRQMLNEKMSKMMARQPAPATEVHQPSDAPILGSFQKGTLSEYLGDLPYRARYGMGALEKDTQTALGGAPGYEDPQSPGADWTGAQRAMSGYLGGKEWGEFLPNRFQDLRNTGKFYKALLTGENPIGYSEPGDEAPGIDMRLHDIQRAATRTGAGEP